MTESVKVSLPVASPSLYIRNLGRRRVWWGAPARGKIRQGLLEVEGGCATQVEREEGGAHTGRWLRGRWRWGSVEDDGGFGVGGCSMKMEEDLDLGLGYYLGFGLGLGNII